MINDIPKKIIRNSTASCFLELNGYTPVEGWALTLALRGEGKADALGVAADAGWSVDIPTDLVVGHYWWQVIVNRGGEQFVPLSGELEITPDLLSLDTGFDGRSEAQKGLDAVESALANKATKDQLSYKINGRELQRYSVSDLLQLRTFFVNKVRREKGKSGFKTIRVRM